MKRLSKGAVLMMTLLVLFIISLIAATLMSRAYLQTSLLWNRQSKAQLDLFNKGVVNWVKVMLWVDQKHRTPTTLNDSWAIPLDHTTIHGGTITGKIDDAQSRWNCNNMVYGGVLHKSQVMIFEKLLRILKLPTELAISLAQALVHDSFGHSKIHRPTYLIDISELYALPEFSDTVIARLRPYVTALPGYTKVNANTASPEVLAAVVPSLDMSSVQHLIAKRDMSPFYNMEELYYFIESMIPSSKYPFSELLEIVLRSDYFSLSGFTEKNGAKSPITVLIKRDLQGKPYVIWFKRS
ncbi:MULTISPECIES: type II secretion system minor pseudopilin GspK [Candidatus Ichthyocystis]|uniref:type II secretion system minor pseudopilin GspK n=1 Tax=Candidatus Ichthyocystis TaxID=2929841 RepID=UPI0015854031|nr:MULTISPECIES: type II secretion system minor pseudopilin GspK [Ichthyocystis]